MVTNINGHIAILCFTHHTLDIHKITKLNTYRNIRQSCKCRWRVSDRNAIASWPSQRVWKRRSTDIDVKPSRQPLPSLSDPSTLLGIALLLEANNVKKKNQKFPFKWLEGGRRETATMRRCKHLPSFSSSSTVGMSFSMS